MPVLGPFYQETGFPLVSASVRYASCCRVMPLCGTPATCPARCTAETMCFRTLVGQIEGQ
ncbi:hypothetical protein DAEQUDRAFT_158082 [Daedalea quercina L-15889]|uniref:Uncharacterized protein n=1 Tax=Daedalea quercina L-15889 TaxID=1314783 RepID=A0A165RQW5_9APHY|nr:hypothetical protein DAEQUDRAFT_158082 [Daedalea quercina L-15889]